MEFAELVIHMVNLLMTGSNPATVNDLYPSFQRAGSTYTQRQHLTIDMTPMVDLGFLLISFFVFTTELSQPVAMRLTMPKDGPPVDVKASNSLTILLDKGQEIYYYSGEWKRSLESNAVLRVNYAGDNSLRNIIIKKQSLLDATPLMKEGRDGLMLIIKASGRASYKNLVDVLDEVSINQVRKYAVVKITREEESWLESRED